MSKLIASYRATPTPANLAKIAAYIRKHPMAVCMASVDELAFIRDNGLGA